MQRIALHGWVEARMNTGQKFALIYNTLRAARAFHRGFCVDRVIVRVGRKFAIVAPATARRLKLRVVH